MILWNVIDEYVCVKLNLEMGIEKSGAYQKYEMRKGKKNGNGKCDENVMIT